MNTSEDRPNSRAITTHFKDGHNNSILLFIKPLLIRDSLGITDKIFTGQHCWSKVCYPKYDGLIAPNDLGDSGEKYTPTVCLRYN